MNYRVRSGDTLGSTAARFNVGRDTLLARNVGGDRDVGRPAPK